MAELAPGPRGRHLCRGAFWKPGPDRVLSAAIGSSDSGSGDGQAPKKTHKWAQNDCRPVSAMAKVISQLRVSSSSTGYGRLSCLLRSSPDTRAGGAGHSSQDAEACKWGEERRESRGWARLRTREFVN